jgi:nucleoside 2-deoxyribosyltransferase
MKRIYLAIPYSFNPSLSFKIANKVSAELMASGNVVFSPISHSHRIADYLPVELRTDSQWWMQQDLPLVAWADELKVVCIGEMGIELIEQSKGVQQEIKKAKELNKQITIYEYND